MFLPSIKSGHWPSLTSHATCTVQTTCVPSADSWNFLNGLNSIQLKPVGVTSIGGSSCPVKAMAARKVNVIARDGGHGGHISSVTLSFSRCHRSFKVSKTFFHTSLKFKLVWANRLVHTSEALTSLAPRPRDSLLYWQHDPSNFWHSTSICAGACFSNAAQAFTEGVRA